MNADQKISSDLRPSAFICGSNSCFFLCASASVALQDERIVHQSSLMFIAHPNLQNEPTALWAIFTCRDCSTSNSRKRTQRVCRNVPECASMCRNVPSIFKTRKRTHGILGKMDSRRVQRAVLPVQRNRPAALEQLRQRLAQRLAPPAFEDPDLLPVPALHDMT